MLLCIDGTSTSVFGRQDDELYNDVFSNSFVRQLYEISNLENKQYFQGPDMFSLGRTRITRRQITVQHAEHTTNEYNCTKKYI